MPSVSSCSVCTILPATVRYKPEGFQPWLLHLACILCDCLHLLLLLICQCSRCSPWSVLLQSRLPQVYIGTASGGNTPAA